MKKSIVILLFFIALGAKAQGNLQFNQVINLTAGSNYTVPPGKVLKIESISYNGSSVNMPLTSTILIPCNNYNALIGQYAGFDYLTIANLTFSVGSHTGAEIHNTPCGWGDLNPPFFTASTSSLPAVPVPIWLQSGKSVNINSGTFQILISGIEFNVVQ